jgi:hypothetical protein
MAFFGGNPFVNEYMGPAQQVAPAIPIMPVHPFAPALPPDCLATPAAKKARPACDDLIPRAEALALAEVAVQSAVAKKEAEMQKAFDDAMAKLADAQRERERDAAAHVAEVESLRSELASAREDAAAALTAAVVMEQEAKAASSEHAKAAKKDEHAKQLQKEVNYFKSMQAETAAELRRAERSADLQASRAALDRRDELEALSMEHTAAVKGMQRQHRHDLKSMIDVIAVAEAERERVMTELNESHAAELTRLDEQIARATFESERLRARCPRAGTRRSCRRSSPRRTPRSPSSTCAAPTTWVRRGS